MNKLTIIGQALTVLVAFGLAAISPQHAAGQSGNNVIVLGDDVSLRLGATLQPRAGFAYDEGLATSGDEVSRLAFGLRRLRVRMYTNIGSNIQAFIQLEGAGAAAQLVDVRADYRIGGHLTLRAGRFVGAQPRSYAVTSHSDIDAVDRPAVANEWARATIGADGRDYGVEAFWRVPQWQFRLYVHNGYNGENFRTGISDPHPAGTGALDGMAFSLAGIFYPQNNPGVEIGAYGSYNNTHSPLTQIDEIGRSYHSYSAHVYWGALPGSQSVRIKADLIGIEYGSAGTVEAQRFLGISLLGAAMLAPAFEAFARYEYLDRDVTAPDNGYTVVTGGAAFSLSALRNQPFHHDRLILAYSSRLAQNDLIGAVHSLILQAQIYF